MPRKLPYTPSSHHPPAATRRPAVEAGSVVCAPHINGVTQCVSFCVSAFTQQDVCVNGLCRCSRSSWQNWDWNPPANSAPGSRDHSCSHLSRGSHCPWIKIQILPLALSVSAPVTALQPHERKMDLLSSEALTSFLPQDLCTCSSFLLSALCFLSLPSWCATSSGLPVWTPVHMLGPPGGCHQAGSCFFFAAHVLCN